MDKKMKDVLKVYGPLALLAIASIWVALSLIDPAPPSKITFAAGSPGGAYYDLAQQYREQLAESDVDVEILTTRGSMENLELLRTRKADVAFVQGGVAEKGDAEVLRSLAGLFHEPFWVFVRADVTAADFGDLRSARLAIGPEGSGTRALAMELQGLWGGDWPAEARRTESGATAAEALLAGDLDAAAFSASIDAPYVNELLRASGIRLLPFDRAPALSRRTKALAQVTLYRGLVDLQGDLPASDVPLIASVAQLAVNEHTHPAIQSLLLEAAEQLHAGNTAFADAGEFPDQALVELPLSSEAERYWKNGPSFLRNYFSFQIANFLERAWVFLIPLATLLIPLVRVAPPLYRWRVRRKIYVWYSDLRELETRGREASDEAERDRILDELSDMQQEVGALDVPLSYTEEVYHLRSHITFVRNLIRGLDGSTKRAPPTIS
ncbi:TAXI family TRAP transporter solute-binding subunit [Henriciella litoralis]|uniref:TAXI family TRAP transporter solute-binding subunit n=1 Tax=Henriciella litoralis TaxID=568102 RepID=UPI000A03920D|nr:TAXI family TRAP transporter solute-binding subunit [Henriciella litoralis]